MLRQGYPTNSSGRERHEDDWVLIYEGGNSGCVSLLTLPLAVASLFGAVVCFGNFLDIAGLLRLPEHLELDFTRTLRGEGWSEWTVIASYVLLVAGLAASAAAWKTLRWLSKSLACIIAPTVVYQGILAHMRFEYPCRSSEIHASRNSAISYWLVTAGEKTWRIRHSQTWQFEYELRSGAEIRVKYPSRGGPNDLIELWVKKGVSSVEAAPLEKDEWVQVLGQPSIWKLIFGSLAVLTLYLPCVSFLLAASLLGIVLWTGNLLQFAGLLVLPPGLEWNLKKELMRAAGYEKALVGLTYLAAGAAFVGVAWTIVKGLWKRVVATVLPPLAYEGLLDNVYEGPHNRYGFFWKLTAGEKTWRIDAWQYTGGGRRDWFEREIKPGREIRVVYPQGGGTDILELWLKEKVITLEDPEGAQVADDLTDADTS